MGKGKTISYIGHNNKTVQYDASVCCTDTESTSGSIRTRLMKFDVDLFESCLSDVNNCVILMTRELKSIINDEKKEKHVEKIISDSELCFNNYRELKKKFKYFAEQNYALFRCYDDTQRAPAQDDPRWLVMRNDGIGASEAGTIMMKEGMTFVKWVKEKAGVQPRSFTGNYITEQGHQMEPVVGKILDHKYNTKLLESTSLTHLVHPFIRASLDRYGWIHGMPHIIEIKAPFSRVPIDNSIPSDYDLQMYQQHDVSQIKNGIFADALFKLYDNYGLLRTDVDKEPTETKGHIYYGAIIKYPHNKRSYSYSPIETPENCYNWVRQMKKALSARGYSQLEEIYDWVPESPNLFNKYKVVYWRLIKFVLVPHAYNPKWCEENLEHYKKVWKRVADLKKGTAELSKDDIEEAENNKVFDDDDEYIPPQVPKTFNPWNYKK